MDEKDVDLEVQQIAWLHEQKAFDWLIVIAGTMVSLFFFLWALKGVGAI